MSFLDKFFGGKDQSAPEPSGVCRVTAAYLDCPYEYIPQGAAYGDVAEMFDAAVADGTEQGYFPVLIDTSDVSGNLATSFYDNVDLEQILSDNVDYEDGVMTVKEDFALDEETLQTLREYRVKLIAEWQESDAEEFLQERIEEYTEDDEEFDMEEEWGGDEITFEDIRQGVSIPFDFQTKKSYEMLLAKIPAAEPWQIAAWLPMGGWNECPPPKDLLAMAKRWYEKYGAVIGSISSDELEFRVSNPPTNFSEAYELAKEQYYFCQDRVEQYAGDYNLKTLANGLTKSSYWYFWWD